jgi:hypothetical protein
VAPEPDELDTDVNAGTAAALRLFYGVRNLPADLTAAVAFVLLTNFVVLAPVVSGTPLRVLFGLPFVLFVPGYAFIAALFPESGSPPVDTDPDDAPTPDTDEGVTDRGIDGIERVALSFGLSIAVVPLIGLILNFTPWGIRLVPILIRVSGFTLISTAVAASRRWAIPEAERFEVPYEAWFAAGRQEFSNLTLGLMRSSTSFSSRLWFSRCRASGLPYSSPNRANRSPSCIS